MNTARHFKVVLASSVSMPVLAISNSYNDEDRAKKINEARADALARNPSDWSDVESRLLSPETLDS